VRRGRGRSFRTSGLTLLLLAGAMHFGEHLWWDHAMRHHRRWHHQGHPRPARPRACGCPPPR
jgi:hypothetical protein